MRSKVFLYCFQNSPSDHGINSSKTASEQLATGPIGGATLDLIVSTHPEILITVLTRTESKAESLSARYPSITTRIGSLSNLEILESSAAEAHIVINTAPDITNRAGISAILKGLKGKKEKGYYIHTSGAALIWDEPDGSKAGEKIWDDIEEIKTITSMPETATHRNENKLVLESHDYANVAIISPVMVYGLSPSTDHHFPLILPDLIQAMRHLNSGFTIPSGKNIWGHIHVKDLAAIYHLLLSQALKSLASETNGATNGHFQNGPSTNGSTPNFWGPEAYYFAASHEVSFLDLQVSMIHALNEFGVLETDQITQIDITKAEKATGALENNDPQSWAKYIAASCGINMRVLASRAKAIGWVPKEVGVLDIMEDVIEKFLKRDEEK